MWKMVGKCGKFEDAYLRIDSNANFEVHELVLHELEIESLL